MKIETKYSIGQTVYFLESNSVRNGRITKIFIETTEDKTEVEYRNSDSQNIFEEIKLFKSKKELLENL